MKSTNLILISSIVLLISCTTKITIEKQEPVSFTAVHINDGFWAPKIEINRTVSIPSAFHQCEINGRIDNFALAGKAIKGQHKGDFPFDDTDVYKIIEGASYTLAVKYDQQLDKYLDSLITLIAAAQEPDGYLYTCITNKCERLRPWYGKGRWDRINSHELYNCGHLYEAAVAHYQATGKRNLLEVAIKNADLIDSVFGPADSQKKVPSGHPIIEMALVKLWRATGENRYLKLAHFFIEETGKGTDGHQLSPYSQDHKPIVDQDEAMGHAVRLGYLYSGVTDVASLLEDSALMKASMKVWENVVSKKLYITGGIGSRSQGEGFGDNYELNNMTAYCETCAAISNVYWNYRLFLNEPKSAFYDVLERTLYNGVISGVSLSGDKFFYDNPLESDHTHERAPWFGCACCPGNVTRFMASIPGYVYTSGGSSIMVNLFIGSEARIPVAHDTVSLTQTTNYPWDGNVTIEIRKDVKSRVNLLVRIPGWVNQEVVPSDLYRFTDNKEQPVEWKLNGKTTKPRVKNGYAFFARQWKEGDKIAIEFPMAARKIKANELVMADRGRIALQRGPLVYCLEDKDNNDSWLFDTFIDENADITAEFDKNLLGGLETLSLTGYQLQSKESSQVPEKVALKAIPYFAWNNRGAANMLIWIPCSRTYIHDKTTRGKEMQATATSSSGWASGLNDGFEPVNSGDIDKHFFCWWDKEAKENRVQYDFKQAVSLSKTMVYWLIMNHYEGNYSVPESWSIQYKNSLGQWKDIAPLTPCGIKADQYNTVEFAPVMTKAIRINAVFQPGDACGILEWKVF
ncbi:MAG TPA: six-hairpin glycosidase [Bacteroidales bacterium]|nr:MAG: six-hairpin glycosidase [Bacteroidetes bacterium GWE2_42_24]OFY31869.1 MAG: six-hairpin glycosidase [Bacteroidetes bacterium GWF2_43_11]HAQ65415.1 six-hairpin glycosidase [Bacteroidales bacterium]HBZ66484.1 six-hairpin glycosidase [Bacteroidales bacterium]